MRSFLNANDALSNIVTELIETGDRVAPRGSMTSEITEYLLEIKNPQDGICTISDRKVNYKLVAFELASYVGGCDGSKEHADLMCRVAPNYRAFVDETTGKMNGMYGVEIGPQLPMIIDILRNDPYSRQAYLSINNRGDLERASSPQWAGHEKDIPCTLGFNFRRKLRQDDRYFDLDMTTHIRSNDVHLGATYDFASFTLIQRLVAAMLEDFDGRYRHFADSMHIYHEKPYTINSVKDSFTRYWNGAGSSCVEINQPDFTRTRRWCDGDIKEVSRVLFLMVMFDLQEALQERDISEEQYKKSRDHKDQKYAKMDPFFLWVWRGMTGRMRR